MAKTQKKSCQSKTFILETNALPLKYWLLAETTELSQKFNWNKLLFHGDRLSEKINRVD